VASEQSRKQKFAIYPIGSSIHSLKYNKPLIYAPKRRLSPQMGNLQSAFCQVEERSEERAIAVEGQILPSKSAVDETIGSFVVTASSNNGSKQEDGADVVVVTSEDVPEAPEAVEEKEEKKSIVLETAPSDPRFPTVNASRYCYVAYNEYHKCVKEFGKDAAECRAKARTYRSICPSEWIAHWNELREEGTWFGKY
jgi:cytochrome c oxidase subunit 6b